jgi:hypothetical protein
VILLERSNEWNLSPAKEDPKKKREKKERQKMKQKGSSIEKKKR